MSFGSLPILHAVSQEGIISVFQNNEGCKVKISTKRLILDSLDAGDFENLKALYGDARVTAFYMGGKPITDPARIQRIVDRSLERQKKGDLYHGLAARDGNTHAFRGYVCLGYPDSDEPGVAELAGAGHVESWNQKFGTEVGRAMLVYARTLRTHGFPINGASLSSIEATVSPGNTYSIRLQEKLGFQYVDKVVRNEVEKLLYRYTL